MTTETSQRIARNIERSFSEQGFAEQGVEALRSEADVSLRTLYKYYPSREAMIVGALEYRDRAYLAWLKGGPGDGVGHVLHLFRRLGDWLGEVANTGCLFSNALADYPDSAAIEEVVLSHKEGLAAEFLARLDRVKPDGDNRLLADQLLMIHEGMTQNAQIRGREEVTRVAMAAARTLLADVGIIEGQGPAAEN